MIDKILLQKNENTLLFILLILIYLFDIGNIDALRQGTEGFYLLITQEMFNTDYYLTPRLVGGNHWSKPPLHFLLPMPFVKIFDGSYLFWSRFSILFLSTFLVYYISSWNQKYFKRNFWETFFIIFSTFGILKYSRIYMMEMPLTLLSTCSVLSFYHSLKVKTRISFFISSLFLALSVLIKGPISLIIILSSVGFWLIIKYFTDSKRNFFDISVFIKWTLLGASLGSLWFIWCWFTYKNEFIEYFFIRENLGKFSSKNYSIRSVIQGLILYSIPFSFFLPITIKKLRFNFLDKMKGPLGLLAISFCIFYFIWFFPKQKSHHYAIPSIIFFLLIIQNVTLASKNIFKTRTIFSVRIFFSSTSLVIFSFVIFSLRFSEFSQKKFLINIGLALTSLIIGNYLLWRGKHIKSLAWSFLLIFASVWIFLMPIYYLPTLPSKAIRKIGNQSVDVVFRKPFFIKERLNREIGIFSHNKIKQRLIKTKNLAIVPEDIYRNQKLDRITNVAYRWPLWKRGLKPLEIIKSAKEGNLDSLKRWMLLIRPISQ